MIPTPAEPQEVPIPHSLAGERLDRAVTALLGQGTSRSRLARWIRDGRVALDGRAITKPGHPVTAGQVLRVEPPGPEIGLEPLTGEEPVFLYEDEVLAVLDKPAGLPMHGNGPGDPRASVASFLRERYGDRLPTNQGPERPGIVHRLDADTTGVCVVAFDEATFTDLQQQFAERVVEKEYRALVYGKPRFLSDWIDRRVARDKKHPERVRTVKGTGPETRDALTYWEVLERFDGCAYLKAKPHTGRTHQIRVHLASIQLPIIGDPIYKARNYGTGMLGPDAPEVNRTLLHAHRLSFEHPGRGERLDVSASLPPDMQAMLEFLSDRFPPKEDGWS